MSGQQWRQAVILDERKGREEAYYALDLYAEDKARQVGLLPSVEEEITAEMRKDGMSEDEIAAWWAAGN